ncbi:hypothetical protein ABMA28_002926 [Loxostege sticticalis]|uniref:Stathmin n=1 Tax=Loxostege sticticalis TaxID=481309 RepID=A0ABD0SYG5_LOXSC
MGCGSSGSVVPVQEETGNGHSKTTNGVKGLNGHHDNDHDSLPTVVLPETPVKPKPPVAFEIPLDEFDANRKEAATPPPHLQRLLQPPQPEISLPDIEEKLAEAEQRRLSILQQRAASAQKRSQRMMKSLHEMDRVESDREHPETGKHGANTLTIPPEPGVCEDKYIT